MPTPGRDYARKAATLRTLADCQAWREACEIIPEDRAERLSAVTKRERELRRRGVKD